VAKNKFEAYKNVGLSQKAERNFNILRGVVMGSLLENSDKKELCEFLNDCEEYFAGEDLEDEDDL
jgi:hypothetical protein